jgi:hypothetical protein
MSVSSSIHRCSYVYFLWYYILYKIRSHTCSSSVIAGDSCKKSSTTIPITTPAPPKLPDVRLPHSVLPELYTVELQPNMYEGPPERFTFNGTVRIRVKCHQTTSNITLHINKLNLTGTIHVSAVSSPFTIQYTRHDFDKERQFLIIYTSDALQQGHQYDLDMSFIGPLKDDLHGLYRSTYTRNNRPVWVLICCVSKICLKFSYSTWWREWFVRITRHRCRAHI